MRVRGTLRLVGSGSWSNVGVTTHSVVEVGDTELRNLRVTDYLGNYLHPGEEVTLFVARALGAELVAIERGGRTYRISSARLFVLLVMTLLKPVTLAALATVPVALLLGGDKIKGDADLSAYLALAFGVLAVPFGLLRVAMLVRAHRGA